ncbi:MAG: CopG family transcriptional regulator [Myxococcota bacterium]
MRISVELSAALIRDAKKLAAERGVTLTAVIEDALRRQLAKHRTLPVFKGDGLMPGVELHDTSMLLELVGE